MKEKILKFLKNEIVLVIAGLLALISAVFVAPSKEYIGYIDFKVLAILMMLMAVVAGFTEIGVFKKMAIALLKKVDNLRQLKLVLILICFFSSMLITNDVALITFVPFSIMVLNMADKKEHILQLVVLETIAANMGSMLTPLGNPQNLFIYANYNMDLVNFMLIMLPYCIVSLVLLIIITFIDKSGKDKVLEISIEHKADGFLLKLGLYLVLFALCLYVVISGADYKIPFIIVMICMGIINYKMLFKIDFNLILTFIFFFIFIGNLGNIEVIKEFLVSVIDGSEFFVSIALSQVFSNVPATMLISGFAKDYEAMLVGVNIGGLGTIIASMASLISYKFYMKEEGSSAFLFMKKFTIVNILFMVILVVISLIF